MKKIISNISILSLFINFSIAQSGVLNTKFGTNGYIINKLTTTDDRSSCLFLQPDGKIVQAGTIKEVGSINSTDLAITRYNSDGTLDNTFDGDGKLFLNYSPKLDDNVNKVVVLSDGKILIAGEAIPSFDSDILIAKFNSDGSVDNSFNNGKAVIKDLGTNERIYDFVITSDNKILATGWKTTQNGYKQIMLIRFNSNGTLDTTFGTGGYTLLSIQDTSLGTALQVNSVGKIIVTGYSKYLSSSFYVAQFNKDGSVDKTFGTNGYFSKNFNNDIGKGLILQGDKIIVCGYSNLNGSDQFVAFRLNSNGTIDNTFGTNGYSFISIQTTQDQCVSIGSQSDGKFILSGRSFTNGVGGTIGFARIDKDGKLDTTFGKKGVISIPIEKDSELSAAIITNNEIIIGGSTYINAATGLDFMIAKVLNGNNVGTLDFDQPVTQILIYPTPFVNSINIEYQLTKDEILNFELYDMQGNLVENLAKNLQKASGKHNEILNINSDLTNGLYLLCINNGVTKQYIRIIK